MKANSKSKRIALTSMMVALITIFSFVPVSITGVPIGLMVLPLLIISQIEDFKMTVVVGLWLGIINLIAWYTTKAGTVLAPVFQNPLVCVVPRVLIGVVAYLINRGLKKLFIREKQTQVQKDAIESSIVMVSTAAGVLTNTGFVSLFTLILFHSNVLQNGTVINVEYLLGFFGVGFLIEIIAFPMITAPVVLALKKAKLAPNFDKKITKKEEKIETNVTCD